MVRKKPVKEQVVINKSSDKALEYAESIINTLCDPLLTLDSDLRVVKVNRSFYTAFKVTPADTLGQFVYDLGNKQWDIPKLRELLENILTQKSVFNDFEVEHDFATIGKRTMLLNARRVQGLLSKKQVILLAIEDITLRLPHDTESPRIAPRCGRSPCRPCGWGLAFGKGSS
jgi:PAS domain-containing protein